MRDTTNRIFGWAIYALTCSLIGTIAGAIWCLIVEGAQ